MLISGAAADDDDDDSGKTNWCDCSRLNTPILFRESVQTQNSQWSGKKLVEMMMTWSDDFDEGPVMHTHLKRESRL